MGCVPLPDGLPIPLTMDYCGNLAALARHRYSSRAMIPPRMPAPMRTREPCPKNIHRSTRSTRYIRLGIGYSPEDKPKHKNQYRNEVQPLYMTGTNRTSFQFSPSFLSSLGQMLTLKVVPKVQRMFGQIF